MTAVVVPTTPGLSDASKALGFVTNFARIADPACP